jgi:exopolysaccharide production protein ExoQ
MVPQIATAVCALGIAGLFALDRDPRMRMSKALWLPIVWLFIGGSRNVGEWLHFGGAVDPNDRYLEGNPLDRTVLTALLVLGIVVLIGKRQRIGTLLRANVPIVLYFAYCGISIFWSDYPYVAFKRWNRGLGDFVMVLIILSDLDWLSALRRVLARTGFLLVPLSVLFIRYFPELGRSYSRYEGRAFFTGVSTDKNGLGMICLIFGLSSLWCFLCAYQGQKGAQRRRRLVAHGTILAMVGWLTIKADSATSVACLFLAGALMVVTSLRALARKTALVHAFVVAAFAFTLYAVFLDTGGSLVGTLGRDPTLTGRTTVWKLVTNYASSPLFGTGFESFWLGERLDKILSIIPGLNEAHNGYLEVYLNLGWVGVMLLALIIVVGYRNVVHALRHDSPVGRLRLAYFAVGVVYNLTEAGFKMMSPIWIIFLLSTMAVHRRKLVEKWNCSRGDSVLSSLDENGVAILALEDAGASTHSDLPVCLGSVDLNDVQERIS